MSETLELRQLSPEIEINDVLALRLFDPTDSEAITEILRADSDIQRYITWTAGLESSDDVRSKIEAFQRGGDRRYALLENGQVIGYGAVYNSFKGIEDEYEIGYFVAPDKRGKGYAKAVVNSLMATAVEQLGARSFALHIEDSNLASQAVAVSLGFMPTDEFKEDIVLNCTERRYERLADE